MPFDGKLAGSILCDLVLRARNSIKNPTRIVRCCHFTR
jgi:hypothetical protein